MARKNLHVVINTLATRVIGEKERDTLSVKQVELVSKVTGECFSILPACNPSLTPLPFSNRRQENCESLQRVDPVGRFSGQSCDPAPLWNRRQNTARQETPAQAARRRSEPARPPHVHVPLEDEVDRHFRGLRTERNPYE